MGRLVTELGAWRVVRQDGRLRQGMLALCASLMVAGCSASRPGARGQYEQAKDSATQASLSRPELAVPQVGEKLPVVPALRPPVPLRPVRAPVAGGLAAAGVLGGQAVIDASKSLDDELLKRINEALAECANKARAEMLFKHFQGGRPTAEKCNEVVGENSQGKPITWAMQLGVEQHQFALACADEALGKLKPGGYSLSPRYRHDSATGKTERIPSETVKQLRDQGRGRELRETLEPDIVIHVKDAQHQVEGVYDYKFPCVNTDRKSPWRDYPAGRSDGIANQRDLYKSALKVEPQRVQPYLGVY